MVPPEWRTLPRVTFSELMEAIDSNAATAVEVWADRDPSVYWPPQPIHQPFPGKRCIAQLTDGSKVWADVPIPEMEARAPPVHRMRRAFLTPLSPLSAHRRL